MKPIYIKIKNPEDWDYAMARGAKTYAKILAKNLPPEQLKELIEKLEKKK